MPDHICLIVDEDSNIRTYLRLILKRRGINSLEAANAPQALRVVQRLQGHLDLILTDILIPGDMNGIDLGYSVRQGFPRRSRDSDVWLLRRTHGSVFRVPIHRETISP